MKYGQLIEYNMRNRKSQVTMLTRLFHHQYHSAFVIDLRSLQQFALFILRVVFLLGEYQQ